ncbi:Restriction endonuclease [Hartmannibacter diazotrophicus]|uniref:Restriction endonuclease n=1 Tax=Hartmannibacter diazotrophicus TaxID=1482074 RepID=A0A2C9DAH9_9HYPH|nr:restriction endonuclease [Hartmannibacter diazotrophicus]SON57297.1 Restriction endonuclease [Hartmannibacter diazotrophicus]
MSNAWMVRAERNSRLYDFFKDNSIVAIGWFEIGSLEDLNTRKAVMSRVEQQWPERKLQAVAMDAGQLFRFRNELAVGDMVLTYDQRRRVYLVGTIAGPYRYDRSLDPEYPNLRSVTWRGEVSRDLLSVASRNSLGAISTLFLVPKEVADDVERALTSHRPSTPSSPSEDEAIEEGVFANIQAKALEFAKDRVSALGWEELQDLVAGLLRALGYRTRVSAAGPDRGKDIVASPDGFGFEAPRIVVEVKHRQGAMGSQQIRSFLGGRHPQDKGLYVSTGGFTKDAYYEAERANIPMALMTIDELVESLVEHYDNLDMETKQLLPMKRIYWPA